MSVQKPIRVLVADDQRDIREGLRIVLKTEGYEIETAESPAAVLRIVQAREVDVVLLDLNYTRDTTSGQEGLDILATLHAFDHALPVVVMTAWGSIDLAVEAMRAGARDFIQKPWDNSRLLATVRTQAELGQALRKGQRLENENSLLKEPGQISLVATSPAMRPVLEVIERVGPSDANVLISGENGTGKGVLARALHAASRRRAKALVSVNIGGLTETLFESELFGHVRGAFTDARTDRVGRFELADGGTLFLDEIANVPLAQQAKLLRVLETGEFERVGSSQSRRVDVRLISATNSRLRDEVAAGRFREDLFFRLNTVSITLPPLRERIEDIPALAGLFLSQHAGHYRKKIDGFDDQAMRALLAFPWPGNIRELDHVVERAVLMAGGRQIGVTDLALGHSPDSYPKLDDLSLDEMEYLLVKKALKRFDGSVRDAAQALGLSRSALYRRLQRFGL